MASEHEARLGTLIEHLALLPEMGATTTERPIIRFDDEYARNSNRCHARATIYPSGDWSWGTCRIHDPTCPILYDEV
jgi:hypothetical protein